LACLIRSAADSGTLDPTGSRDWYVARMQDICCNLTRTTTWPEAVAVMSLPCRGSLPCQPVRVVFDRGCQQQVGKWYMLGGRGATRKGHSAAGWDGMPLRRRHACRAQKACMHVRTRVGGNRICLRPLGVIPEVHLPFTCYSGGRSQGATPQRGCVAFTILAG
jgi:hypothetical protein